jgi:hypothetical protein
METFDTMWQAELLDSPEAPLWDDPIDDFDLAGEIRWLIRPN